MRNEIPEFSSKCECFRFEIIEECVDTEIGVRYFRRVDCSGKSV
jgi:hypothetical protein